MATTFGSTFRFSTNIFGIASRGAFTEQVRRAERLGYDTVFSADHLGMPAPFSTLVAAAYATERIKVGTLVINAPFWNPSLLAREIATADVLTDGRLEIGLGSGHMKWEFDAAGIGWEPFGARADRLSATIGELRRQFAEEGTVGYEQQAALRELGVSALGPVQRTGFGGYGPPLIVGGTGDRVLKIAAEHADIVSIAGAYQIKGQPPGTMRFGTAAEADERVRYACECAGERAGRIEWHALTQMVLVTDDRRATARQLLEKYGPLATVDELLGSPFALIGTVEEMAEQLLRNRERYGFTYYTVHAPYMDAFAPVMERVRAMDGHSG